MSSADEWIKISIDPTGELIVWMRILTLSRICSPHLYCREGEYPNTPIIPAWCFEKKRNGCLRSICADDFTHFPKTSSHVWVAHLSLARLWRSAWYCGKITPLSSVHCADLFQPERICSPPLLCVNILWILLWFYTHGRYPTETPNNERWNLLHKEQMQKTVASKCEFLMLGWSWSYRGWSWRNGNAMTIVLRQQ